MKKRIFAILLTLIMVFQIVPITANAAETIQVNSAETLFSLNQNLSADVNITSSFTVDINESFVRQHGAWYIGSADNPFIGEINGNGNTITINVDTNVADWALFHTLDGAKINNLKIDLANFHSSTTDDNVSVAVLAQKIKNVELTNMGLTLRGYANTKLFNEKDSRVVNVGTVAIIHEGKSSVSVTSGYLDLMSVPNNAEVIAGSVVRTSKIANSDNTLKISNRNTYKTYVYANDSSYLVGGSVASVGEGTLVNSSNAGQVYFRDHGTFSANSKKSTPNVVIGGAIGEIRPNANALVSGDLDVYLNTFGVSKELTVGASVGINYGGLESSYATTMVTSSDTDDKVTFLNGFDGSGSTLHIGGVVGQANGNTIIHSNGTNMKLYGTDIKNSALNLGVFVGSTNGTSTKVEDNGASFQSKEITVNNDDSLGIIIGKDYGTDYLSIEYNIINATNEKSLKDDYDWISLPVGNIPASSRIDLFKNNYWAYMGYAELNVPTQIYFTFPMNVYGDNPPLETSADYPFLATYSYLYPTQETNQYLTFQNPTERGIGKVLLTKDCLASVKVAFQILDEYSEPYWGGHYYKNADVLNYLGLGEDDEDDDGIGELPDGPGAPGDDTPTTPPSDEGGNIDKELVNSYYYTRVENGREYSCYRNEWSDSSWDESCILVGGDIDGDGDDDTGKEIIYDPNHNNPDYTCTFIEMDGKMHEKCEKNNEDPIIIYDENHGKTGYTCTFDERDGKVYETCIKDEEEIIYDKNHGKTGYTCYFNQRDGKWYETCEKDQPEYVYDRNHGKSGYYCYFDKVGNTYYETCEKETQYVYDKNHGKAGYTCEFNYKSGKYVETCVKDEEYIYDVNHGKSGYVCEFEYKSGKYYETCEKKDANTVYDTNHGKVGYKCYFETKNNKQYETCVKESQFTSDKNSGKTGYICTVKKNGTKYYETCEREEDVTPEGWDKDFVRSGFAQAVINKGKYAGSPLPTFTENSKSNVTFNYYNLPYEIKYTNKSFSDIKGNRFEEEIIEAANRLIVQGYGDGKFGPDKAITRAEFATMVVRTLGFIPSGSARFTDVTEGSWYYDFVNTAADWGIVVGIGNDLFAPDKNITRQEAAIMLMRAAKILEEQEFEAKRKQLYEVEFYGWEDSAMWARTEVIESVLYDIVDLRANNQFEPLENITRAETASALLNLLKNYELINK